MTLSHRARIGGPLAPDDGDYNLTTVPAGTYPIEIAKTGFRSLIASDVVVNQNNVVRVDAQLQVGAVSENG